MTLADQLTELRALAQQVRAYQIDRGWSDADLLRKVSHIGSAKPYRRILNERDDLADGMDIDAMLQRFREAIILIDSLRSTDGAVELEYPTFRNITNSKRAIHRALQETGIRRLVVIQGESGTGKDAVMRHCVSNWSNVAFALHATESWRHSVDAPYRALLATVGVNRENKGEEFQVSQRPFINEQEIIRRLNARRYVLFFNETHHMGPRGINMLKDIITLTETVVVILTVPTLIRRIEREYYEEARQLFGNRLKERVTLETPAADEIHHLLKDRGAKFADVKSLNLALAQLVEMAPEYGNWSFVVEVARELVKSSAVAPLAEKEVARCLTIIRNRKIGRSKGGVA
jgi:hypothetical protein